MIESSAPEVRRTRPEDWQLWRGLRLAALTDAPSAFGSTIAQAREMPDEQWRQWWAEHGDTALRALAFVDGEPAGMVACQVYRGPDADPDVLAMWVDPRFRGRGVADALILAAKDWARAEGHRRVRLGVTIGNEVARRLYLRHGFVPTGEQEPLRYDEDYQIEYLVCEL